MPPKMAEKLSDGELRKQLQALGETVGPITASTRYLYVKKLNNLSASVKNQRSSSSTQNHGTKVKRSRSGGRSPHRQQPKTPSRNTRVASRTYKEEDYPSELPSSSKLGKSATVSSSYYEQPSTASINLQTSLNSTFNRSYDFNASTYGSIAGKGELSDAEYDENAADTSTRSLGSSGDGAVRRRERIFNNSFGKGMTSFGRPLRSRFYDRNEAQTGVMGVDGFKVKPKESVLHRVAPYVSKVLLASVVIFVAFIAVSYVWMQRDEELLRKGLILTGICVYATVVSLILFSLKF